MSKLAATSFLHLRRGTADDIKRTSMAVPSNLAQTANVAGAWLDGKLADATDA